MAIGIIAGSIGQVGAAAGNLVSDVVAVINTDFLAGLRAASLGGVQFGVLEARTSAGRRNVVHEYPGRDGAWVEDQGQQARRFDIVGFLVESPLLYAGGALSSQRENLLAVIENLPTATLVHPTLGTIADVNVLAFEFSERLDLGRVIEFRLSMIQGGPRIFPMAGQSPDVQLGTGADSLDAASVADFAAAVAAPIQKGAAVIQQCVSTAVQFYGQAVTIAHDARRMWSSVSRLPGAFGRFFGGANAGFSASNAGQIMATTTGLLAADTAARAAVDMAGATLTAAALAPGNAAAMGAATKGIVTAVAATSPDPAQSIRILSTLAAYAPTDRTSTSPVGVAMASVQTASSALMRRAALAQIARTVSAYQPASLDDARAMRTSLTDMLGKEILSAGNAGDSASYRALRTLRRQISENLDARAGGLASLRQFRFASTMPSLVLAHRIYADAGREPGLVKQANPFHPAFVPTTFRALAK